MKIGWKVSFFGLGYVGLVTAACFASRGFKVVGFDVDEKKVRSIKSKQVPIFEPGLKELVELSIDQGLLNVTTDYRRAVIATDVSFITVSTPSKEDGTIDLSYVEGASKLVGKSLRDKEEHHLVVVKSTVIPGTTEKLVKNMLEDGSGKECGKGFGLCYNPEFLKEGSAVEDTFNPDRIIIGEVDKMSGDMLESLYKEFHGGKMPPVVRTNAVNAEMIKYANNAFLAMKVSFINSIANLCQKLPNADVEVVAKGIGLDRRIGKEFLRAGLGWGGSCWPKDLKALLSFASGLGEDMRLVKATLEVNERQPYRALEVAKEHLGSLKDKRIAILGLAFKPNTDDVREAVSIKVVKKLVEEGAKVVVHDPRATDNAKKLLGDVVRYAGSPKECIKEADCCIVITEWDDYRKLDPDVFTKLMRRPIIIDGRRVYDPREFARKTEYRAVGLGPLA